MCGVAAQMMIQHFQLLSANGEHTKSQQQQQKSIVNWEWTSILWMLMELWCLADTY